MLFSPAQMSISIDWDYLRQFKHWRRQAIALFAHELTHAFEWVIIYRRSASAWNSAEQPEQLAEAVQDIVLIILGGQLT